MALTLDALYASPDHYLHSFEGDHAVFVPMNREAYRRSIFLDGRISAASTGSMRIPVAALEGNVAKPAPTCWIFHIAHCGSTLLARALDDPTLNLVLREPLSLRQCALVPDDARIAVAVAMLSKRYQKERPTIVKANVPVNFLLDQLVARDTAIHAIFMHYSLRDYVLAILRNDNHRTWLRNVTAQLVAHLGDLSGFPDAHRAAALWLAQMRAFAGAIVRLPHARSLDAESFFADPRPVLRAATRHFEVPMSDDDIDGKVAGPLFATYSKNPAVSFDNDARLARRKELEDTLADELAQAQQWIETPSNDPLPALTTLAASALLR